MTAKDIDKLVQALSELGAPATKRVINFRNNRKERDFEVLDYTELVVPQDCKIPLTMEQQVAKIMYTSGQIDEVAYARMVGISYDDDSDDFDMSSLDYDEVTSAQQSSLASYDDETLLLKDKPRSAPDSIAKKDTKGADAPSKQQDSESSAGAGVSPDSAGDNLED